MGDRITNSTSRSDRRVLTMLINAHTHLNNEAFTSHLGLAQNKDNLF
jgi:hypothetical protein